MEFDQTSTDLSMGWGKEVIRFGDLDLIFKVTLALWNSNSDRKKLVCTLSLEPMSYRHFETQILIEKSLCAHYLLNQWQEFDQTSTDTSVGRGKEVIRFCWLWPHFQGHFIIKTLKMSLVCHLSHESIDGIWPNLHRFINGMGERSD